MLEKMKTFLSAHLDFRFYSVTWIALVIGLAIVPALMYMPQKYGYENGLLESIQMVVLFAILAMCLTSKVNKRFFRFAALALTIIMISRSSWKSATPILMKFASRSIRTR